MKSTASDLKAHLGRYMKAVRRGEEITITDRDELVAKLVPYAANTTRLSIRPPIAQGRFASLKIKGVALEGLTAMDLLDASRGDR